VHHLIENLVLAGFAGGDTSLLLAIERHTVTRSSQRAVNYPLSCAQSSFNFTGMPSSLERW